MKINYLLDAFVSTRADLSAGEDDEELLKADLKTWSSQGDLLTADDE